MRTGGAIVAAAALIGAAAPPAERVVRIDTTLPVTVDGAAGRVRIDPAAPERLVLAPEYAARAKLTGGGMMAFGATYIVGRERVVSKTQVAAVGLDGGRAQKARVVWAARAFADGPDAVMGPGALEEPVVRFVLRAPIAGERTLAIPMMRVGGLFGNWGATSGQLEVAGQPLRIRFAPYLARSVATAAGAAQLAEAQGGQMETTTGTGEIVFGLTRPVRAMRLARPLAIGPLAIPALMVRTADTGSVAALPTVAPEGEAAAGVDPDEIVVVAKGKRKPGAMVLGADYLTRCSAIVFDKPAQQIRLTCG